LHGEEAPCRKEKRYIMYGIAGLVSKRGDNVAPYLYEMLQSIEHRGSDGAGVAIETGIHRGETIGSLSWDCIKGSMAIGHTRLAVVGGISGQQPFVSDDGHIKLLYNGEVYNYKYLRHSLSGRHRFTTSSDGEVIIHLLSDHYQGNLGDALHNTVNQLDGVYAIAATDGEDIIIARDPVGVKQVSWGENDISTAFASEKKALWNIGIGDIHRLLPGQIARLSKTGLEVVYRHSLHLPKPTIHQLSKALSVYGEALDEAVQKRLPDREVGMLFSGGVDSALIALKARELGARLTAYAAGVKGSSDVDFAQRAAEEMDLSLRVAELSDEDLVSLIPKSMATIEDRSLGQIEVSIPAMACMEMAHQDKQIVLLTGQAPDELFGGYPWYRQVIQEEGYSGFEAHMRDDFRHLYEDTLEREDKISMAYGMELRVPYLDPRVIEIAFLIGPRLKLRSPKDTQGKYVHRTLAQEQGVPQEIAWRPKEAAQHGAGIHDRFASLAEGEGFTPQVAQEIDYHMEGDLEENLGSSQRYGFRYDKPGRWAVQDHVQLWLDSIAKKSGLLSPQEERNLEPYLRQAAQLMK
jgi:asparagine synthase (glutamine-hydrolysing)